MGRRHDCLTIAERAGILDATDMAAVRKQIEVVERQLKKGGDIAPEHAELLAAQHGVQQVAENLAIEKRQKMLQAMAVGRALENVKTHPKDIASGVMALLTKDLGSRVSYSNVEARASAITGQAHARLAEMMQAYRTKRLGFSQNDAGIRNMVRELFGTSTGDVDAKNFAKMWGDTAEWLRQRFNRAGGQIRKREDWGLPQFHDSLRVKKAGRETWKNSIRPLLDRDKMLHEVEGQFDYSTGAKGGIQAKIPLDDIELERALDKAYDRITTDGLVDLVPGRTGGSKLANRHTDERFFVFKDADSWLKYHDQFGHADIYTTLTDHISKLSNETALLEILGPNPESTFRYLSDVVKKDGASGFRLAFLENVWDVTSGKVNRIGSTTFADVMGGVRHSLVAAKLGGAFLSSISDLAFQRITRGFNGLPSTGMVSDLLKKMNPKNEADRLFAVRLGLTADAWVNRAMVANRFTEASGANVMAKVSDTVMRASLLSSWTDAGRKSFGMEFSGFIADQSGKEFGKLNKEFRGALMRYGISKDDWNVIRATQMLEHNGVKFFRAEDVMKRVDLPEQKRIDIVNKVQEMILTETDYAVPTPDARARAITTGGLKKGTIAGEVWRSAFMFKSFPITVISTHLMRGAMQAGIANKAKYLGEIMIATTVLGAIAMQAKEISRGKDPRPMTEPKFWAAAMAQGGGAGIMGDFLFADQNRFGGSLTQTLAGPVAGLASDSTRLTIGNIQQAMSGDDTNFSSELVDFMRGYTPGGSLWYTRLAFERALIDQLDLAVDDSNARKGWRRLMRTREKEFGQGFWWKPGELSPQRSPDLGNVAN